MPLIKLTIINSRPLPFLQDANFSLCSPPARCKPCCSKWVFIDVIHRCIDAVYKTLSWEKQLIHIFISLPLCFSVSRTTEDFYSVCSIGLDQFVVCLFFLSVHNSILNQKLLQDVFRQIISIYRNIRGGGVHYLLSSRCRMCRYSRCAAAHPAKFRDSPCPNLPSRL